MSLGNSDDCFVIEGKMALPYQYYAGAHASRFIIGLRDEKKILATRSTSRGKVLLPPRSVDDVTFEDTAENWVEVSDTGTVTGFTVIRYAEPYQPAPPPYVLALIKLDGADTPLAHVLACGDVANARAGMRVKAVFSDTPSNNIMDIKHFQPI